MVFRCKHVITTNKPCCAYQQFVPYFTPLLAPHLTPRERYSIEATLATWWSPSDRVKNLSSGPYGFPT